MSCQISKKDEDFAAKAKTTFAVILAICLFFSALPIKADWESDANTRIENIRKRDAQISLVDVNDDPV